MEDPPLISAAVKLQRRVQGTRRRSERLTRALGSQLVSSLSDFFAAQRNHVISEQQYEKMHDQEDAIKQRTIVPASDTFYLRQVRCCKWPPTMEELHEEEEDCWRQQRARQQVKKVTTSGAKQNKRSVCDLLKELVRGKRNNKLVLLCKLLRAPIVLAALFSLMLALSLITLYAISFHHCNNNNNHSRQRHTAEATQPQLELQVSSPAPPTTATTVNFTVTAHTINSRHLTGAPEVVAPLSVRSECGLHVGQADGEGGLSFRGIAYASAPVRDRRWRRPRPVWHDEQLCNNSGATSPEPRAHCVQLSPFTRRVSGSEDCLYLDIYAPRSIFQACGPQTELNHESTKLLPVMVYIHGGLLAFGSSGSSAPQVNWMRARPSGQLAADMNVVLVAPNFRLQALGFMALSQLADGDAHETAGANYGLWDQLVALNWVQRNIGAFGGDARAVTLFGPDSAAALPLALSTRGGRAQIESEHKLGKAMINTSDYAQQQQQQQQLEMDSRSLFRSVWLLNPAVYFELPYERANRHYARLIRSQSICSRALDFSRTTATATNNNNNTLVECLMNLTAQQVVHEYLGRDDPAFRLDDENSLPIRNIYPDQFVTLDGQLVRDSFPFKSANRTQTQVNFLLGSTTQAAEFWPCPRNLRHWQWADFRHYVETSLNSFSTDTYRRASELYQITTTNQSTESPVERYLSMVSDIRQVCPARELAQTLTQLSGRPTRRYVIEWRPSSQLARTLNAMIDHHHHHRDHENSLNLTNADNIHEPMPRHAFHHWDLLAFFGFQFDAQLEPAHSDLKFQQSIRQMVRDFVHSTANSTKPLTMFTLDQKVEERQQISSDEYKASECKMWQETLKQSYAWLS